MNKQVAKILKRKMKEREKREKEEDKQRELEDIRYREFVECIEERICIECGADLTSDSVIKWKSDGEYSWYDYDVRCTVCGFSEKHSS